MRCTVGLKSIFLVVSIISFLLLQIFFNSYVITRLQSYTPYEFIVVPFRRGLSGEPSALFEAWTLEARPSQAPSELKWYQVNSSSIDVTWRPILKPQYRGRPLGYQVCLVYHILQHFCVYVDTSDKKCLGKYDINYYNKS